MRTCIAWLLLLAACGGGASGNDASIDAVSADAPGSCAGHPFGTPTPVAGVLSNVYGAWLSSDERTIYYSSDAQGTNDLVTATRASTASPFGAPSALDTVNSGASDNFPSLTSDLQTLYFDTNRVNAGDSDIYEAVWDAQAAAFGAPARVDALDSGVDDGDAQISATGTTMYFISSRNGSFDIFTASKVVGGSFGAVTPIAELNTDANEGPLAVTPNELQIFFTRNNHIFTARRTSALDGFGAATAVTELDTSGYEQPAWVSPDGCSLYYVQGGGTGPRTLDVATRM